MNTENKSSMDPKEPEYDESPKTNTRFLSIVKWFFYKAIIIFPIAYIVKCLLSPLSFRGINIGILVSLVLIGYVLRSIFNAWRTHYLDDDIDLELDLSELENDSKSNVFNSFWNMKWWLKAHWIITTIFLFITGYVMYKGLLLLLGPDAQHWFVCVFTIAVVATLYYLVLMITRGQHIIWFIAFYLAFDLLSAFTFNYVHFYEMVNYAHTVDSDINACLTYMDLQRNNVRVLDKVIKDELSKSHTQDSINNIKIDKKIKTTQNNINYYNSKIENLDNRIASADRNSSSYNSLLREQNQYRKLLDKEIKKESDLLGQKGESSVSASFSQYNLDVEKLNNLINNLSETGLLNNINRTKEDALRAKKTVSEMQPLIETLASKEDLQQALREADQKVVVTNDTVSFVMMRINNTKKDRFESIELLIDWVRRKSNDQIAIEEHDSRIKELANDRASLYMMLKQNDVIRDDIIMQSISLSILIDLLPLALGLFTVYCKKRRLSEI